MRQICQALSDTRQLQQEEETEDEHVRVQVLRIILFYC